MCCLGCDVHVDAEVPPIEVPPPTVENLIVTSGGEDCVEEKNDSPCEFQSMPNYPEGYISSCVVNCCTWVFPEPDGACEEKWCLDLEASCGWTLDSWLCYRM